MGTEINPPFTVVQVGTDAANKNPFRNTDCKSAQVHSINLHKRRHGQDTPVVRCGPRDINILYNDHGKPHPTQSLRVSSDYDASEFSRFMKRLHTKSIVHYIEGYKDNGKCRWIMLNPYLCRKGKRFRNECLCVFDDLSKKRAA